jgi:hypothetical protein
MRSCSHTLPAMVVQSGLRRRWEVRRGSDSMEAGGEGEGRLGGCQVRCILARERGRVGDRMEGSGWM